MTTDFREQLAALADTPDAPPSSVDVALAVRVGRRRLLRNRAGAGAGVVAVAIVTVVAVLTAGTGRTATPIVPGPGMTPAKPSHQTFLSGTDPLDSAVSFGWLPDGFAASAQTTNGAQAQPTHRTPTTPHFTVFLTAGELTAADTPASAGTAAKLQKIPVGVKGEADGYWWSTGPLDPDIDGSAFLVWRIDATHWGTLGGYQLDALPRWREVMPEVAAGITLTAVPVPLPFHIEGLPRSLTPDGGSYAETVLSYGAPSAIKPPWTATLSYRTEGGQVLITAQPTGASPPFSDSSGAVPRQCVTKLGLDLCVLTPDGIPAALAAIGGPSGLLDRITSLGTNPADWTTKVVVTSP